MDWIPAISTTTLLALFLWLSKNIITIRLTNSVRHEYEQKIEQIKADIRNTEELFKAELRAKESQIQSLRDGILSGITDRQAAVFSHQLTAIQQLWDSVLSLAPAKSVSAAMTTINFELAAKAAANNAELRKVFAILSNFDLKELLNNEASKARPFISPMTWAYYSAYQAIISHAVIRLYMLKNGIDMIELIDSENVTKLVKTALPHQVKYIEQHGPSAFHYLLEELENEILMTFQVMLKGEDTDREALEKAANIVKQADALMQENLNQQ